MMHPPAPYAEPQEDVTIRTDVNLKKETLRIEHDEAYPGKFLVAFTFDASVAGSITIMFFAKEGQDCNLTPTKESLLPPVTVNFQPGSDQQFRQPSGTGIDLSMLEEAVLSKEGEMNVYTLAVKAEALADNPDTPNNTTTQPGFTNSQITYAVFKKHWVRVVKQILWVNGRRYELKEVYGIKEIDGIGKSVRSSFDGNNSRECLICISQPRDTVVLPCLHMYMCSRCAIAAWFRKKGCPVCRQPIDRLLEIKFKE